MHEYLTAVLEYFSMVRLNPTNLTAGTTPALVSKVLVCEYLQSHIQKKKLIRY